MSYYITFQYREQYNCAGDCMPRICVKSFPPDATLEEVAEWVRKEAGVFYDKINLLNNPQIIGITLKGGCNE